MKNNLFSLKDYNETHKILKLFGIKIKFPKSEFLKKKKENLFYYYKKNNIDITTIPPATGQIRDIQLANLELLKELDYVCKKNNLTYWLDFGTLLGAIRHKGFIPWDDDIDVSMLRDSYENLIEIFNRDTRDKNMYAQFEIATISAYKVAIKIRHKKCPHLFVDVFPDEFYYKELTREEQLNLTNEMKTKWEKLQKNLKKEDDIEISRNKFKEIIKEYLFKDETCKKPNVLMDFEFYHKRDYWLYDFDMIFPLKSIEYEGYNFPSVNKPKEYVELLYENSMAYPDKIGFGHSSYAKLSNEEKEYMAKLIDKVNREKIK